MVARPKRRTNPLGGVGSINAVVYARFSSHNQKELSIDGQIRECEAYAKRHGINIIAYYSDHAKSGKNDDRAQFQRMIREAASGQFQLVICYKFDRFARNRFDSITYKAFLREYGIRVVSACENIPEGPEGVILESVMEGMGEWYSLNLAVDVMRGMNDAAALAQSVGGAISFGYYVDQDKKYQINEQAAPIVRRIFEMWNDNYRMRDILAYVHGLGLKTKKGCDFSNSTIASIIRNDRYTGLYRWNGINIPGGIPRIISDEVFAKAQIRAKAGKKKMRSGKPKVEYLLTTKLFCGYCATTMVGDSGTSKTGAKYSYYSCLAKKRDKKCHKKSVRQDWIEDNVVELTRRHILRPDVTARIIDAVLRLQEEQQGSEVLFSLESSLKETKAAIANIIKAVEQGFASGTLQERLKELEDQRQKLDTGIAQEKLLKPEVTENYLKYWFGQFAAGDERSEDYRRLLVDSFINSIYLADEYIILVYNYKDGAERVPLSELPFDPVFVGSDKTVSGGA